MIFFCSVENNLKLGKVQIGIDRNFTEKCQWAVENIDNGGLLPSYFDQDCIIRCDSKISIRQENND